MRVFNPGSERFYTFSTRILIKVRTYSKQKNGSQRVQNHFETQYFTFTNDDSIFNLHDNDFPSGNIKLKQ